MKRKVLKFLGIAAAVTATRFWMSDCDNGTTGNPTVIGVIVTPNQASIPPGQGQVFSATVAGTNNPPTTVTWTVGAVSGTLAPGTSIFPGHESLIVAHDQAGAVLRVVATSTFDPDKYGVATVVAPGFGNTPGQWLLNESQGIGCP